MFDSSKPAPEFFKEDGKEVMHTLSNKVNDTQLIFETLKEKCVYNYALETDKSQALEKWYEYMLFKLTKIKA